MAGITIVVSDEPGHPAHEAAAAACTHTLRLATCTELHAAAAAGRVSVHIVAPVHLGCTALDESGVWHYAPSSLAQSGGSSANHQAAREETIPAWSSPLLDGVCVSCDPASGSVTVRSDRFNRHPVFFTRGEGFSIATTEIAPLFRAGIIPFAWDMHGVAASLRWGFPLFPGTLYENVSQSAGATLYALDPRGPRRIAASDEPVPARCSVDDAIDLYADALRSSLSTSENPAVALSGGWDTRATLAVLRGLGLQPTLMTFGVPASTDVELARRIAGQAGSPHRVILFEEEFVRGFHDHLAILARSGNGLATPMAAHEVYVNVTLARDHDLIIDSAGCEFRRGHRIQRRIEAAHGAQGAARLFLATHETGIWSDARLSSALLETGRQSEEQLLQSVDVHATKDEAVDALFQTYVWNGHYTHSANSQSNAMLCRMPMYDPAVHAAYRALPSADRWGKHFQIRAMRRWDPALLDVPISHGGLPVPARDSFASKLPALLRHRAALMLSSAFGIPTARIDPQRGHLDYPAWTLAMRSHTRLLAMDFLRSHDTWFAADHAAVLAHPRTLLTLEYLALIEAASTPGR